MDGGGDGTGPRTPEEEIRFAVVLNGGVSLAVWMGGAVLELDRLTRGRGGYDVLLDLMRSRARADVISGTSAGGVNGAALALSQVNEAADLGLLRDVWADQGRMESLLRDPFRGSPPSLLRGDEYFLPQLDMALGRLASPFRPREDRPIDLTITTTLLRGAHTVTVDALGQRLSQQEHDGRFHFRRDPEGAPPQGQPWRDDFPADPKARGRLETTVAQLALAARCTAGFPVAFEPSFVPVRTWPVEEGEVPGTGYRRPDMSKVASWRTTGPTGERPEDRSRFAVDGGLLVNTPTRAALEAIDRMPASDPVRRVMLLVYPHAPAQVQERPDLPDEMPTLAGAARMMLGALSSQGSRTFVDEIEAHNRSAAGRRGGRIDVLASLRGEPGQLPGALYRLAAQLLPHYRSLRVRRAARDLAARVPPQPTWSYERARSAAESAQLAWQARRGGLPYLPDEMPPSDDALGLRGWLWGITTAEGVGASALDLLKRLVWVLPPGDDAAIETLRNQRRELHEARATLRELRDRTDRPWTENPALCAAAPDETYWSLRLAVFEALYREDRAALDEFRASPDLPRETRDAVADIVREDAGTGAAVRQVALQVAGLVETTVGLLGELDDEQLRLGGLESWRELLVPPPLDEEPIDSRLAILHRLLALEVATTCLADESVAGGEQTIDLVQISLQTQNAFASHSRTADDKVGGWALARFSGFLKQSWRVNDWVWGRLDGATMLCRILLDPKRLRRIAALEGWLEGGPRSPHAVARQRVRALVEDLFGVTAATGDIDVVAEDPRLRAAMEQATTELAIVIDPATPAGDLPPMLDGLAILAAWGLHVRIVREELPALAGAVRADGVEGANRRSRGQQFLEVNQSLLERLEPATAEGPSSLPRDPVQELRLGLEALEAFDRAGIGREDLAEEGTSDQLIRTATTAAGVAVTVADGARSGLTAVKPVTRALRGALLLPYWTITGLTRGGSLARFLALLAFALGGTFLTLALFGALPAWASGPAAALGGGALLAAFAYSALRTGTLLHGLVLLSPVVPLVAYAVTQVRGRDETSATTAVSVVTILLLLAGGLIVLGSLPSPVRSPAATLADALDRWSDALRLPGPRLAAGDRSGDQGRWAARTRAFAAAAVAVGLAFLAVAAVRWLLAEALPWGLDSFAGAVDWLSQRPLWMVVVPAALVLLAGIVASRSGRTLRRWRRQPDGRTWRTQRVDDPAATAAGWSVVYGAVYLVVAFATLLVVPDEARDSWWTRSIVVTALVFAAVLLLVVPWLAPLVRRREIVRQLLQADPSWYANHSGLLTREQVPGRLLDAIVRHQLTYRFIVRPIPVVMIERPDGTVAPQAALPQQRSSRSDSVGWLELTSTGRRIAERLYRRLEREHEAGRSGVVTARSPSADRVR